MLGLKLIYISERGDCTQTSSEEFVGQTGKNENFSDKVI